MHILIADDYPEVLEILAEMLAEFSPVPLTTECARNGAEAVARAVARPPDAVVLDINMPVMDGIEAAIAIRAAFPNPPLLIALTGNTANFLSVRSRQAFDHVLSKPAEAEELAKLLWPS